MASRSARTVGFTPFRASGVLPEGPLPVARPRGEAGSQAAASLASLAATIGARADQLAAIEGERAGNVAGGEPGFRPTGRTTIRGRSYDAAGIRSYVANLDVALRTDMQDLFEANRDNPAGLNAGLAALKGQYEREHVFPEIAASFNADFGRMALAYRNQVLQNFDAANRAAEYAGIVESLNQLDTARSRQLASLDPSDPAAVDVLLGGQASIDAEYDRAVSAGAMTPAAAATAKLDSARAAAVDFYARQAAALSTPAEIEAFAADVRARHAKGELPGIDGKGFDQLEASLARVASAAATAGRQAATALGRQIDSYVGRVAEGLNPPSADWRAIETAAAAVPDGEAMLAVAREKLHYASIIRDRPLPEATAVVEALRRKERASSTAEGAEVLGFAEATLDRTRKAVVADPLGAAERRGLIREVAPLTIGDGTNAPQLAGEMAARVTQAEAVAAQLGRRPKYLRPEEVTAIKGLAASDLDAAVEAAAGLVAGSGPQATAVLRELERDAPTLAMAGAIVAGGGSSDAARDVLAGSRAPEGGGRWPEIDAGTRAKAATGFGVRSAYAALPEDSLRVIEAAGYITRVRLAQAAIDPKADPDAAERIYQQTLVEASGGAFVGGVQFGGIADYGGSFWSSAARVIAPPGYRADLFEEAVKALRDEDFAGLAVKPQNEDGSPIPASTLRQAVPVFVGSGWAFALGDPASGDPRYVRGSDGQPFVLDFNDSGVRQTVRARVPGALLEEFPF